MEILYKIFLYFIIYAFLGWVLEVSFHLLKSGKLINRGFLYGPVCPIYGVGALSMLLILSQFNDSIFNTFIVGFIAATVLEFITGYILEKLFKTKWWDYSQMRFNIMGYVSLRFSIIWGFVCILLIEIIHPFINEMILKVPNIIIELLLPVIFIIFIIDLIFTIISLVEFRKVLYKIQKAREEFRLTIIETEEKLTQAIEVTKSERKLAIDNLIKKYLGDELESGKIDLKRNHLKYLKSYPSLSPNEWRERIKKIIDKKTNKKDKRG